LLTSNQIVVYHICAATEVAVHVAAAVNNRSSKSSSNIGPAFA